jgi:hypothetical protein
VSTDPGRVLLAAVVTAVMSLLVTESYQSTPWLADKFMRWSVRLRYPDNPERGAIRQEELISLLADLPTLFELPTAAGFLLHALASRAAHRRKHPRREPRAVQRSRGARFRLALAKAVVVILCTIPVCGIEFAIIPGQINKTNILTLGVLGLIAGISTASAIAARLSRFYPGLIGGTTFALSIFALFVLRGPEEADVPVAPLSGIVFWLSALLVSSLTRKSRYAGVVIGILVNLMGVAASTGSSFLPLWLETAVGFSGLGIAVGALAGFIAAGERRTPGMAPRGIGARSSAAAQE